MEVQVSAWVKYGGWVEEFVFLKNRIPAGSGDFALVFGFANPEAKSWAILEPKPSGTKRKCAPKDSSAKSGKNSLTKSKLAIEACSIRDTQ